MEIVTVIDHGRDCQPANRSLLFIVIETKEGEGGGKGRFMGGQMSGDSGHENRDFLLPGLVFSWTSGKQALPSPVQGNPTRLTTSYDTYTPIDRPRSIVGILNFFASFHRLRCRLESVKIVLAPLPR